VHYREQHSLPVQALQSFFVAFESFGSQDLRTGSFPLIVCTKFLYFSAAQAATRAARLDSASAVLVARTNSASSFRDFVRGFWVRDNKCRLVHHKT